MDIYYSKLHYNATHSINDRRDDDHEDQKNDDDIENGNENSIRRPPVVSSHDNEEEGQSSIRCELKPVIVFYTGGAWIIGYKMWGTLLGRILNSDACGNLVVVIPDVRNYSPWATVPDMIDDCDTSLEWIFQNIHRYGGDPNNIVLVGQSAGGHIACTTILQKAMKNNNNMVRRFEHHRQQRTKSREEDELIITLDENDDNDDNNGNGYDDSSSSSSSWKPTDLKGFISLSAPYSLTAMKQTFMKHGLDESLVVRIFGVTSDSGGSYGDNFDDEEGIIDRDYDLEQNGNDDTSIPNIGTRGGDLLDLYDPYAIVRKYNNNISGCRSATNTNNDTSMHENSNSLSKYLPPIKIFHGTHDKTVPYDGSVMFYQELVKATTTPTTTCTNTQNITFASYDGWSHTDPILEGPMDADHRFHRDIFESVKEWTTTAAAATTVTTITTEVTTTSTSTPLDDQTLQVGGEWPENDPIIVRRLCPHVLIQIGRYCNPF